MKVLISLLGLSPGVVTGAYYALYYGWGIEKPVYIDKVVTLGTDAPGMDDCEWAITDEFDRWCQEIGIEVIYDPTCRLRIPHPDLNTDESVDDFRKALTKLLRDTYRDDEVYLCVAGGRKTMAGLAAIAVQLFGGCVQGMYHLYVHPDLERDGSVDGRFWDVSVERRQEVMRPPEDQCWLVELPFIRFVLQEGEFVPKIVGRPNETLIAYLEETPLAFERFLATEEQVRQLRAALYEVRVRNYLVQEYRYDRAEVGYHPPYLKSLGIGEVDILAYDTGGERRRVLICECKARPGQRDEPGPIALEEVKNLQRKVTAIQEYERRKAEEQGYTVTCRPMLVARTSQATEEALEGAKEYGIELWSAMPSGKWWNSVNWKLTPQQVKRIG